ncbi:MAG: DUF488 family protein [Gammaproteobacteria bacterium]|nr:DUF488 family protein [Gammaproteobacteria bacterium]
MPVFVVRLGSPRLPGEGLRLGTVRFPPRGISREARASGNWFDVWYPNLAPSAATLREFRQQEGPVAWSRFARRYRREMDTPDNRRTLELLAALSHHTDFAVGCYCADETHCHRSLLRELLRDAGALLG